MSKGSIILGDVSGKLGDIVLYRTAGAQVARLRVRHPKNPRSTRQMVQRVFQATCLHAYSMLKDICDHSFEGKQGKRENFGQFMKENRARMTEKLNGYALGWQSLPGYSLRNMRQMLYNNFIVADGTLQKVEYIGYGGYIRLMAYRGTNYNFTYQDLVDAIGGQKGDEISIIQLVFNEQSGVITKINKARIILEPDNGNMNEQFANADTKYINHPNGLNDGNPKIEVSNQGLGFNFGIWSECGAIIQSRFENGMWKRSFADIYLRNPITNPTTLGEAVKSWWQTPAKGKYLNKAERQLHID
jgi:hypothetical protein